MDVIQSHRPIEHCVLAVEAFNQVPKGVVFLYTGFYVAGYAETDGPIGTYFLARALNKLGYRSIIISDKYCKDFFKEIETIGLPLEGFEEDADYDKCIGKYKPVAHISIERCGENVHGKYANMGGKDISAFTAPLDKLYVSGDMSVPRFAIGDGGNEIGMGNFKDIISEKLSLTPCIVDCDYPIIASVSNWGAYGFIAGLEMISYQSLLPAFPEVDAYMEFIVSLGSIDGVKAENVKSVDGKEWAVEAEILDELKAAVIKYYDSRGMSSDHNNESR